MPLIQSSSDAARAANIRELIHSGKPVKQAVAIGYSVQRKGKKVTPKVTKNDRDGDE